MITFPDLRQVAALCEFVDVDTPQPVVRGLELAAAARAFIVPRPRVLLTLDDGDLPDVLTDLAIREHAGSRGGQVGMEAGMDVFERQLLDEVYTATLPILDDLIVGLRPRFDEAVAPIVTAVREYGFTINTSAEQVLERRDWAAGEAILNARDAWASIQPLITLRQRLSDIFNVSPTRAEAANQRISTYGATLGAPVDYSVAFAAGDNWSTTGEFNLERKHPGVVNLAALAAGGIRLNTPTEVREKLHAQFWAEHGHVPAPVDDGDDEVVLGPTYPVSVR